MRLINFMGFCMFIHSSCALAAYSCTVSSASYSVLYNSVANVNEPNSAFVTFACTRAPGDAATLAYRIKATLGNNSTGGTNRRARLGTTGSNYITYSLRRGAACNNTSNWADPAIGITNVATGNLTFVGASLSQSVNIAVCTRVPSVALPAPGIYTDTIRVRAQHSTQTGVATSDASPHTPYTDVNFNVGVNGQCVFNTFPTGMSFNYTSFSPTPQVQTRNFDLRCSNLLPWSVYLQTSPTNSSSITSVLLGLQYTIAATPATGTGTGNDQIITLTGTIPAGQAGTCSGSSCTAIQGHVVTISY